MNINATTSMVPTPLRATTTFNIGRQQLGQNVHGDVDGLPPVLELLGDESTGS